MSDSIAKSVGMGRLLGSVIMTLLAGCRPPRGGVD